MRWAEYLWLERRYDQVSWFAQYVSEGDRGLRCMQMKKIDLVLLTKIVKYASEGVELDIQTGCRCHSRLNACVWTGRNLKIERAKNQIQI